MTADSAPLDADTGASSESLVDDLLAQRTLIIASNRGPVTLSKDEAGNVQFQRGAGGLVTALGGIIQRSEARWIACARTREDSQWGSGRVPFGSANEEVSVRFLSP
jgi:trehalose-6-phosphate synthase